MQPNGAGDPFANYIIVIFPLNGNEVATNPIPSSRRIIDFSANDTIICNDSGWTSNPEPSPAFPIQWVFGEADNHFDTVVNHFIGIRLIDNGIMKTGWIKYTAYNGVMIHLKSVGYMESCADIVLDDISSGLIDNTTSNNEISVFPNPVHNHFTVRFKNNKKSYLKVLDITRKAVYQEIFTNETNVSTDKFKKGLYFINIINGTNTISRKIILE